MERKDKATELTFSPLLIPVRKKENSPEGNYNVMGKGIICVSNLTHLFTHTASKGDRELVGK